MKAAPPAPSSQLSFDAPSDDAPILLYDGECGLCDRTIQFILARERVRRLRFAPLQGESAGLLMEHFPEIPRDLSTVVWVGNRPLVRSRAAFAIARDLKRPWKWLWFFRILPAFLTDLPYRLIARFRKRLFGEVEQCRLPSPQERERFLP